MLWIKKKSMSLEWHLNVVGELLCTEECQVINVEANIILGEKNYSFATTVVLIDSDQDWQWMLNPLGAVM